MRRKSSEEFVLGRRLEDSLRLQEVVWERLGSDLMLTARVVKA